MSRTVMCLIAFILQVVSYLFFILYKIPDDSKNVVDLVLTIVMVCLLSGGDAVWESQPPAILQSFYGLDRERNAAMANYKMWQSIGWCAQYAFGAFFSGNQVCIDEELHPSWSACGGIYYSGYFGSSLC